jgi:hypothetical protein
VLQRAEIWLAGGRMRIEDSTPGVPPMTLLVADGTAYSWQPGKPTGTKMAAALARRSGRPPHDYARRISEIRSRGRVVGVERVDGHVCDVLEYDSFDEGKGKYWLARDLQDFPVRIVVDRPLRIPYRSAAVGRVELEYRNFEVRIPAVVDAAELSPPAGVRFDDVTQLFLNRGRPTPRITGGPGVR